MQARGAGNRVKMREAIQAVEATLGNLRKVEAGIVVDLMLSYRDASAWTDVVRIIDAADQTLAATKDEIKAEQAAVGWCSQVLDTNGDGKITKPFQTQPQGGFDNLLYVTDTAGGGATVPTPAPAAPQRSPLAPGESSPQSGSRR